MLLRNTNKPTIKHTRNKNSVTDMSGSKATLREHCASFQKALNEGWLGRCEISDQGRKELLASPILSVDRTFIVSRLHLKVHTREYNEEKPCVRAERWMKSNGLL